MSQVQSQPGYSVRPCLKSQKNTTTSGASNLCSSSQGLKKKQIFNIRSTSEPGVMAQKVKCLSIKNEDLNLDLQLTSKNLLDSGGACFKSQNSEGSSAWSTE